MALSSVWAGDRSSFVLDVVPKQALYGSWVLLSKRFIFSNRSCLKV